ncbi:MAG: phosphoribosylanthranilate isomerase [Verrucomicrobia bacterium]|nr:phosphoribosylanthranilate isomerase [Verrucomicrobiota bacterium]
MALLVKICGMTNRDDALYALEAGADYLGFILYSKSPRGISAFKLTHLLDRAESLTCAVGVFVNMAADDIRTIVNDCNLCAIQLHGDESPEDYTDLGRPLWRAVKLQEGACVPAPDVWPECRLVVDADVPGLYGGTGRQADWNAAAALAKKHPLMLAGGLSPDNIAEAIKTVSPLGVDVASGVETSPGRKDRARVEQFIKHARRAEARY